jgi:cyclopropane-fatty-acyl-phospholipid synthase
MRGFANTLIFPGGCLPSVTSIGRSVARVTDMRIAGFEDITPHYAETLRRWRQRFLAHREDARDLGYDERFLRLWELYLAFSEGGFRERRLRDAQIVLAKPGWRGERALLAAEDPRRDAVDERPGPAGGQLAEREDAARAEDVVPLLD